jgi:hypothetical protein
LPERPHCENDADASDPAAFLSAYFSSTS